MENNNKNKGPNKNRQGWGIILFTTLLVTFVVMGLYSMMHGGSASEISYDKFLKLVDNGKVESVTFTNSRINIVLTDDARKEKAEGKLTEVKDNEKASADQSDSSDSKESEDQENVMDSLLGQISQMQGSSKSKEPDYYTGNVSDDTLVKRLDKAGVEFKSQIPDTASSLIMDIFITVILPIVLLVFMFNFLMKKMSKGGGMMGIGKSNAKMYMEKQTGVTFLDVAGEDEAKESLQEVVDFLHNPGKYTGIGAKLPKGALLVGPPGTGKTLLAKDVKMDETVNLEEIALATSGAVGSDLANMINEAAITAVKHGRQVVSQKDLFEAVEVVLVGKEKKDRIMSAEERRIVSYHEVGHALVTALQKNTEPVQKITIVPRTMGALGYVMQTPEEEKFLNTKKELEAMIVVALGGRAAEEIVFDTVTTGASNDIEQATKIARAMITQYGMSERFGLMGLESVQSRYLDGRAVRNCGEATAAEIDEEIMKMLKASYEEAKRLLSANRDALDKIAAFLIEKETITGKEFMKIFREVKGIPEPEEADGEKKEEQESGRILMKPTETQAAEPETVKEPETEKEPETQATEIQSQETVAEEKLE